MIKVTERGIEHSGENELSQEDLDFIRDMFGDYSEHEKHPFDKQDRDWDD